METSKLTGELVCDIYELTNKDGKNIQKLAKKIEEGEGVAEKFKNGIFKKSSYNASTILLTKITYKYQSREETLSLLHYAISHKNNQAVKDLLEEAKKQKLLKEVLNEEMTTKHSDGREETHTILTDAISRRDNDIMRVVLKISEENGILGDILNKKATIKNKDGQEITYTPFNYANIDNEIAKIFKEFTTTIEHRPVPESYKNDSEKNLNATTMENKRVIEEATDNAIITGSEDATAAIDNTESVLIKYEDINKSSRDLQLIFESSEEAQIENTVEPTSEPCFDSRSGSATGEKDKPLTQQRQAILAGVVGAVLLVGSIVFYILKVDVTVAVVVGIVGLACMGFALYNIINPNTKLEKVRDIEQSIIAHPPLNPT